MDNMIYEKTHVETQVALEHNVYSLDSFCEAAFQYALLAKYSIREYEQYLNTSMQNVYGSNLKCSVHQSLNDDGEIEITVLINSNTPSIHSVEVH